MKLDNFARIGSACGSIPTHTYFDFDIYQIEQERIFKKEPIYVGCDKLTANKGDYFSLKNEEDARILVRSGDGVNLLSNVCRHRQAVMLQGNGNAENIVCPLHRWTYENNGTLLGAPRFDKNPCRNLRSFPLQSWNSLLFEQNVRSISESMTTIDPNVLKKIDLSSYRFDRALHLKCDYNWKTFIEFYLEDYHVDAFHPGLSNFVDCDQLRWNFGEWYSVQTVGIKDTLRFSGQTETYRAWQTAVADYYGEKLPEFGAIWVYIYPNVMIEWYPMVLVVSTITPDGPQRTLNQVEFYHPEDIMLFDPQFAAGARSGADAYLETAQEDDEIGRRMQLGRKALWKRGASDVGPYQSPLEDGMVHFHTLYRKSLSDVIL
jgi:choline monooxygenase